MVMRLEVPPLGRGALHVWRASVDVDPPAAEALGRCLSDDERLRAARRRRDIDRQRYVTARGVLRSLLAGYIGCDPAEPRIGYGPQGKPLVENPRSGELRFNVTHSGPLAIFAFARGAEVGIDIERVRGITHADRIARRIFPERELESWRALPPEEKLEGFFARWTRVEAVAKLHGGGVWWLVRHAGKYDGLGELSVMDIAAPEGFRAAAAVGGPVESVVELDFPHTLP